MDNNQNKKTAGAIALIVIAVIVITIIIIAIATNRDNKNDPDVTDRIEDNAESDLSDAVTDMIGDASEAIDDVGDALDPDKDTNKESEKESVKESKDTNDANTDIPPADTTASLPTEYCLPVTGYISKSYSLDTPVFSLTMNDYRTHGGIDIQAEQGVEVAAFAKGTVTDIYSDPFMGVCMELTHSGGMVSRYMNLDEEIAKDIEVGSTVSCGQTIAKVGSSASMEASDESHLHFEVMVNDCSVDPMSYIDASGLTDTGYEE